jgi:hypothetical protein
VASTVRVPSPEPLSCGGAPVATPMESLRLTQRAKETELPAAESSSETESVQVFAEALEFVALPGASERLQRKVVSALRDKRANLDHLLNCLVLFSQQEPRLVTVITLWKGTGAANGHEQTSERLKKLIDPFVDRWLRERKFVTFLPLLSAPLAAQPEHGN